MQLTARYRKHFGQQVAGTARKPGLHKGGFDSQVR